MVRSEGIIFMPDRPYRVVDDDRHLSTARYRSGSVLFLIDTSIRP